jgi:histidine triad (HIT) family protein
MSNLTNSKPDCLFCKFAKKEIPVEMPYQNHHAFAIKPKDPIAPHHLLIIPWAHEDSLVGTTEHHYYIVLPMMFLLMKQHIEATGIDKTGFRIVMNNGSDAHQAIKHMHMHVIGGSELKPEIA